MKFKIHKRVDLFETAFVEADSKEEALAKADGAIYEDSYREGWEIVAIDELNEAGKPVVYHYLEDDKFIDAVDSAFDGQFEE